MEKTTELSEKALLYKSAIDLDNKKRQESQKVLEKVTLLLEAPSAYTKIKNKLGWDEEETYIAHQNSNISFLKSLEEKYPNNIILDQEEVLKLCIKHNYVLISAIDYKYKTSKELISIISEYFEKVENVYPEDIYLLIPSYLNIQQNLSEQQIIEYRNSVKTDDILVLHRVSESRNAEINYYSCLNPINQVKKDTRSWIKKVIQNPIYIHFNDVFFTNMSVFSLIITIILLLTTLIGGSNILDNYYNLVIASYLILTGITLILPKLFQTKDFLFNSYTKYVKLQTSEEEVKKSNLYSLLTDIYYSYTRNPLAKFSFDYFKELNKKDLNIMIKKTLIYYLGYIIVFLSSYYGYYYVKTNTDSKSYTFTEKERGLTSGGFVIKVNNTYEIKRNNFFSYTKTKIN